MDNGDLICVLSNFGNLILEVEVSELNDVTFLVVIDGRGGDCQNG